jgi:hypothetical protein
MQVRIKLINLNGSDVAEDKTAYVRTQLVIRRPNHLLRACGGAESVRKENGGLQTVLQRERLLCLCRGLVHILWAEFSRSICKFM